MRTLFTTLLLLLTLGTTAAEKADVVVVGATPGGVAAAVAAARSGAKVVLLEESRHVGGIVSGGLTNTDIRKHGAVGGLYVEFKRLVVEHYTKTYGANSSEVKLCKDGNMFQPKVAELVFRQLLTNEKNIRLIEGAHVVEALTPNGKATPGRRLEGAPPKQFSPKQKLAAVTYETASGRATLSAPAFIDATYEGDLAALAGSDYRVGRESRSDFKEKHAGKIYVRFGDANPLPGSTGEADAGIQAFCFRFHLTKDPANLLPVEKPADFNREDYKHLLADIRSGKLTELKQAIQFYPMPGGNFEINSDHPHPDTGVPSESLDLAEENYGWPEAGVAERARLFRRYWNYQEGLIWLLQHDAEVPEAIRKDALRWGFPKDEFTDNRGRPHHIYVRQGRRIWGEHTVTENNAKFVPATGLPARQADGIAVAEFEFDSHGVSKFDPKYPGIREGYFFIAHDPFQIPYRSLIPKTVDGLLVPVACSASHVGYQTIRMEPVFMALGEASGIAAAQAVSGQVELRKVDVPALQREILKRGGVILYENTAKRPEGL
jgi:hypothetical protein